MTIQHSVSHPTLTVDAVQRDWRLLAAVPHAQLIVFVREWYRERRSWITITHWLCIAASFVALLFSIAAVREAGRRYGIQLALAPLLLLFILPLHEGLHDIAYRLAGARQVNWTFAWRQLMAYVTAHHFVATPRALTAVALAPFVTVSVLLITAMQLWPRASVLTSGALLLHTFACAGDLAMLNYFWHHRDRDVVTFDDAEEHVTYFYAR